MKPFRQMVVAVMLLLFLVVSGADCLVPNASMSSAEKACCEQTADQCDNSMTAVHPCCKKAGQNEAELNETLDRVSVPLPLHLAVLELVTSLHIPAQAFIRAERRGGPPHGPSTSSLEILRI